LALFSCAWFLHLPSYTSDGVTVEEEELTQLDSSRKRE